jgi:hypothetical protein
VENTHISLLGHVMQLNCHQQYVIMHVFLVLSDWIFAPRAARQGIPATAAEERTAITLPSEFFFVLGIVAPATQFSRVQALGNQRTALVGELLMTQIGVCLYWPLANFMLPTAYENATCELLCK